MVNETNKALEFYAEWQATAAVIIGMLLQFALGDKRGMKIALVIALSAVFVALFIVPAIFEVLGISPFSKVAVSIYALSALLSAEIIALCITVLPEAVRLRTKQYLGVQNDRK
jgi:hypothetical protein